MAYCDVCENFDWEHVDGDPEVVANMTDEGKRNFQPDPITIGTHPMKSFIIGGTHFQMLIVCVKYASTLPTKKRKSFGQTISVPIKQLSTGGCISYPVDYYMINNKQIRCLRNKQLKDQQQQASGQT